MKCIYRVELTAYGDGFQKKSQTVARFALEGDANDWAFRIYGRLHGTDDNYAYVLDVYKGRQKVYRAG